LGTQQCRSSSFDSHDAVPKPELGNEENEEKKMYKEAGKGRTPSVKERAP
jgi:hypothetical protein